MSHPSQWDLLRIEVVKHAGQLFRLKMRTIDKLTYDLAYLKGYRAARYPLPVIPVHTGYVPSGTRAMSGVPYIWVVSRERCWTFWKKIGLVEEWFDRDGLHKLKRYVNHGRGD